MGVSGSLEVIFPLMLMFVTINCQREIQPSLCTFGTSIQTWTVGCCEDVLDQGLEAW